MNQFSTIKVLRKNIKVCTLYADYLPYQPRPVFSFSAKSKILIVGQAPGIKVHKSGVPWDDASGDRLRRWIHVSKTSFMTQNIFLLFPWHSVTQEKVSQMICHQAQSVLKNGWNLSLISCRKEGLRY